MTWLSLGAQHSIGYFKSFREIEFLVDIQAISSFIPEELIICLCGIITWTSCCLSVKPLIKEEEEELNKISCLNSGDYQWFAQHCNWHLIKLNLRHCGLSHMKDKYESTNCLSKYKYLPATPMCSYIYVCIQGHLQNLS